MPTTIEAQYRWTTDEFLKAHKYHRRHQVRRGFRWAANTIALAVSLLSAWSLAFVAWSVSSTALLLAGLYWLWLHDLEKRWWLTRKFRRRPDRDHEVRWTFSEDEIKSKSDNGEGQIKWEALAKWLETPEGFLMYPDEDIFIWLPFTEFRHEADVVALRDMASGKVPVVGRVG